MAFSTARGLSRFKGREGKEQRRARQFAAALAVFGPVALAGCGGDEPPVGTVGFVTGFFGAVATDEPRAALIGRDVLSAGGSAADAVTAMYFASAVTLPSRASLGGGGICVGFDADDGTVVALDFLPRAASRPDAGADRPTAVPGNVRGFFAFQARQGRLRWSQILAPAENLARFGTQVSRTLANDLAPLERALIEDPEVRRTFAVDDPGATDGVKRLVREGDFLRQVELATVIARVRGEGAGAFYTGSFPQQFADASRAAGGSLTVDDLRDYRPQPLDTVRVAAGRDVVHTAGLPAGGGAVAARIWTQLAGSGLGGGEDEAIRRIATAAGEAGAPRTGEPAGGRDGAAARSGDLPLQNPSAASFVAVDRDGSAAACSVTLNSSFGTGRIAPGTGIFLAAAPGPGGRGAWALGPMLIVNENVRDARFAGAATGGVAAPAALAGVAARVFQGGERLAPAIAAPRAIVTAAGGVAYVESGGAASAALSGRGLRVAETPTLGEVAAIACPGGARGAPDSCEAAFDPRGNGLALTAEP